VPGPGMSVMAERGSFTLQCGESSMKLVQALHQHVARPARMQHMVFCSRALSTPVSATASWHLDGPAALAWF